MATPYIKINSESVLGPRGTMPSLKVIFLSKMIVMAKSSRNRKQLAEELRTQSKEWQVFFGQILEREIPSLIIEIAKWVNIIIGRLCGLLPSEKAPVKAIVWMLNFNLELADKLMKLLQFFSYVNKAADLLVLTTSGNSNKPSSKDIFPPKPEKKRREKKDGPRRKPGGQKGHKGSSLKHFPNPDKVIRLKIDPATLPPGDWKFSHVEVHQVVSVKITKYVVQIESEVFVNGNGEKVQKPYPKGFKAPDPSMVSKCGLDENGKVVPLDGGDDNLAESPQADVKVGVPPSSTAEAEEVQATEFKGESDSSEPPAEAREVQASDVESESDSSELGAERQDSPAADPVGEQSPETRLSPAESVKRGSKHMVRAAFPEGAKAPIQYDNSVRALSTFYNVAQLIPCGRVHEIFRDVCGLPVSTGSVCEFRAEAAQRLHDYGFAELVKKEIIGAAAIYVDETGINVLGNQCWLHITVTDKAVFGSVLESRSGDAIESMGILSATAAVIIHDHYAAYDRFNQTLHSLCNAHLLRELKGLEEKNGLKWPVAMSAFLLALKKEVDDAGGKLGETRQMETVRDFLAILQKAEEECPPEKRPIWQNRGRAAKSKGRNLVERLRKDVSDVLRFMTNEAVAFTNNAAEQAVRMQKVHLKISGCFRNAISANEFVLIRCYLMTCAKNGISALDALTTLFSGKLPPLFPQESSEASSPPDTAHHSAPLASQAA
jgi:hypothetical protein